MSDSGTDSESEKEILEGYTRQQLYHHIKKSGCKMLAGLHLKHMTKETMISHLVKSKCPELEKIMKPKK